LITERNEIKTDTLAAITLIAIWIITFACQGFTYTTREQVIDPDPLQMTTE
jgi:hypothetical protein